MPKLFALCTVRVTIISRECMKSRLPKIFVYHVNDCYVILLIIQNDIDTLSYPWSVTILRLLNLKYIVVYTVSLLLLY